jgi:HD superfamily phosphohydrolase
VDVDKFDYLQRDAAMCGVKVGCDFDRLIKKRLVKVRTDNGNGQRGRRGV